MKDLLVVFGACLLFGICGCEESGPKINRAYAKSNIVCDNLYQGDSIEDAVTFLGAPDDKRKSNIDFIKRQDKLAQGKELEFANRLFNTGRTRSAEDYTSLLSNKMKKLMAANDKRSLLNAQISAIRDGQAFSAPCEDDFHGKCDAKYAVTFGEIDKKRLDDSNWHYFPDKPTHQLLFFHFHKPNYSIIGEYHYLVEKNGDYKIVAASLKNRDAPEYKKGRRVMPVTKSGIEKKTVDDLSGRLFEKWHIGLTEDDNKKNTFDIIRTSRVISGEKKLDADFVKEVFVGYDYFAVRAKAWDYVRFEFAIDLKNKQVQSFGPDIGGRRYSCRIGTGSTNKTLKYPGMEITNINLKEEGVFKDGKLELLSFDSTGEDGTVYRNSVFVRLTPKESL